MDLISRYREMMKRLLPFGKAWTRDALSTVHQLLDGLSVEFARIHERAEDLLAEMEPSGTVELLPEWESAWGLPNQCTGALSTLDERWAALLAKMIHVGQQTPGFFVRVAATLGYTITIDEHVDGNPYVWRIVSTIATNPIYARAGTARAGDPIRTWGGGMLECAMRALNPAHLEVLFSYNESAVVPEVVSATIWANGTTITLVFNQALSHGAGYSDADFNIDASLAGQDIGLTYVSGAGTDTHIYTLGRAVMAGEVVTIDFSGGDTSLIGQWNSYLSIISGKTVQNNSEQNGSLSMLHWPCFDNSNTDNTVTCTEGIMYDAVLENMATTALVFDAVNGLYVGDGEGKSIYAPFITAETLRIFILEARFYQTRPLVTVASHGYSLLDVLFYVETGSNNIVINWDENDQTIGLSVDDVQDVLWSDPLSLNSPTDIRLAINSDSGTISVFKKLASEQSFSLFFEWTFQGGNYSSPEIRFGGTGAGASNFAGYISNCQWSNI